MKETYPIWRRGENPIDVNYVEKQLENNPSIELQYKFSTDDIIAAEGGAIFLRKKGFEVVERENRGAITLVVSNKKLEGKIQNA